MLTMMPATDNLAVKVSGSSKEQWFPVTKLIAVILGNGPTLEDHVTEILAGQRDAITFGCNRIYTPVGGKVLPVDYYLAMDRYFWDADLKKVLGLKAMTYFVREKYYQIIINGPYKFRANIVPFKLAQDPHTFSIDIEQPIGHGFTSVYPCLQLAYMAGAKEMHVYGVDFANSVDQKTGETKSHFWGNTNRSLTGWKAGKAMVKSGVAKLRELGVEVKIHSDLFNQQEG